MLLSLLLLLLLLLNNCWKAKPFTDRSFSKGVLRLLLPLPRMLAG